MTSLNAPFGARCFLTRVSAALHGGVLARLNAPFGARCFLTILAELSGLSVNDTS